ncbi:MAG: tetraacyldisaccharide 4'-kinase [Bacteroidales bacterium]|nr:tetraacyldisaccharide 4'-kinase [Bacteroidales bacterium]
MISKYLLFPYYLYLKYRDRSYESGRKETVSFDVPVISVGNVSMGGTGKTPAVEAIARILGGEYRIAVVSRGYRRRTKGFLMVDTQDTADKVGDEPLQIKRKFPEILVAVDSVRERAIGNLLSLPESERPQVIILDDGFQYRRLLHSRDIVLVDSSKPVLKDNLFPLGRLRDLPRRLCKADIVLITKCAGHLDREEREALMKANGIDPSRNVFFTVVKYLQPVPVFGEDADRRYIYSKEVYLFSGVGDDTPMLLHLTDRYDRIYHRTFPDHHRFNRFDIGRFNGFAEAHPRAMFLTTEKDAQRLLGARRLSDNVRRRLFYLPIEMEFLSYEERQEFASLLHSGLQVGRNRAL